MLNSNKNSEKIILIDGNAIMYRAYYGVNKNFVPTFNNMPVGMVYGFSSILLNIVEYFNPEYMVVTFDSKEKTFRHDMDSAYKANRKPAPDDFYPQMPYIDQMIDAFNCPTFKMPGFESDDLIGSITESQRDSGLDIYIVSGDLDFTQLVSGNVKLIKVSGKISNSPVYGEPEVIARYGVTVDQMVDFKAITGDSSDNYSGIPGVGPKTAEKLLTSFNSIDNIMSNIDKIEPISLREKIINNADYLFHCRDLAAIKTDIDVDFSLNDRFILREDVVGGFFQKMGFNALYNRLLKMNKESDQNFKIDQKSSSNKSFNKDQMSLF